MIFKTTQDWLNYLQTADEQIRREFWLLKPYFPIPKGHKSYLCNENVDSSLQKANSCANDLKTTQDWLNYWQIADEQILQRIRAPKSPISPFPRGKNLIGVTSTLTKNCKKQILVQMISRQLKTDWILTNSWWTDSQRIRAPKSTISPFHRGKNLICVART